MSKLESFPRPTVTYHSQTYDRISQHHGFNGAGKTILVIGGSSGVGHSICKAFAQANVARIAIISRSLGPQAQAKSELEAAYPSTEILIYQASITDSIRMTNILQELGTVDVLVLCAAVVHRQVKATEVGATKAYLETPLPAGGMKTIINITSAAAQTRSPFRVGYGPSKAAITQVMQHFAWERESEAVRVFSFHPGVFYTPSVAENYAEHARVWEDINLPAHFAVWLAGPESGFLNERGMERILGLP
ncbi:hypothetical protein N7463_001673 [Penicillium fimorum]|uniref:Uncharacterized protein n=1 Tax=Penicillium fimorum TaxID=1882269 RepID=A0A9X0C7T0_9EURO|nr:hypothetical protein N7463_001673 [Penicillium fimorum]